MATSIIGTGNDIRLIRLIRLILLFFFAAAAQQLIALPLQPLPPVELTGTHGKFDFIKVDAARRRLLACHTGNGTLDVIDLDSSRLLKSVPTGAAQGVAVDDKHGRYFVSVSKPPQLVIIDAAKLEVTGTVPLPGPADLVGYLPEMNRVFVDDGEKPEMWIIDPESKQIMQTNTFPGTGMEDFCFDKWGTLIFQNLKDTNQVAKSDFIEQKIPAVWSTLPAEKPHGLALVNNGDAVAVAGGNGKLVVMSMKEGTEGKVLASANIAPRVDEIAYDPDRRLIYAASGTGVISIVVLNGIVQSVGSVSTAPGAHSIAVDPKTHAVWIVFVKGGKACVQRFDPAPFSTG
jgi:DNA-binding beta-propeller fold protein YncE